MDLKRFLHCVVDEVERHIQLVGETRAGSNPRFAGRASGLSNYSTNHDCEQ